MIDYIAGNGRHVLDKLVEHVELTALAVVIGLAISFPVALLAYKHRRIYAPVTAVAGVLYTIPSLALFAFLAPYTGLSFTTAQIGLVGYTLLILIRNIVAGLDSVPGDAREAALGMGYSGRQLLWAVELPLALPTMMAGIRIATVTTIGLVTVTALITLGGLGALILEGVRAFGAKNDAIYTGAVLSVSLAVAAEALLTRLERRLAPWSDARRRAFAP